MLTAQWAALFNMYYLKKVCNVTSEEGMHTRGRVMMGAHYIEQCNALFSAREYTCKVKYP